MELEVIWRGAKEEEGVKMAVRSPLSSMRIETDLPDGHGCVWLLPKGELKWLRLELGSGVEVLQNKKHVRQCEGRHLREGIGKTDPSLTGSKGTVREATLGGEAHQGTAVGDG
jgi:hypothetical protein